MWGNNSRAGLGYHHTADYGEVADDAEKQAFIEQKCLIFNILILWIKKSMTTDTKLNFRSYNTS